ncbi:hypothetical protein [Chelativorans sp. Marseille-P2723]|uniref:hypothetical protein n=1 Tax=Chelativorans sp. Marseille-P2723 TaxID=2709133 RepID=UPI0015708BCF|nr:hypothetical protein [Chelativorans sp. Marseille-P2723]
MSFSRNIEDAARLAMANVEERDPLPPAPNYGPFGYFRLSLLIFAAVVAILLVINLVNLL